MQLSQIYHFKKNISSSDFSPFLSMIFNCPLKIYFSPEFTAVQPCAYHYLLILDFLCVWEIFFTYLYLVITSGFALCLGDFFTFLYLVICTFNVVMLKIKLLWILK